MVFDQDKAAISTIKGLIFLIQGLFVLCGRSTEFLFQSVEKDPALAEKKKMAFAWVKDGLETPRPFIA
jgi:hypothetical protein